MVTRKDRVRNEDTRDNLRAELIEDKMKENRLMSLATLIGEHGRQ